MEKKKSSSDRRGVQSLFIPNVPKIILNTTDTPDVGTSTISHSRSAGELVSGMENEGSSSERGSNPVVPFHDCNGSNNDTRYNIDLYCSPRLQRRSFNFDAATESISQWSDALDNSKLGPGSRVDSTVSLTSEYTARSIGLISNDSSSDSTQFSDKIEQIKQKQNLLRRYVSNPEKPQNDPMDGSVQRTTKSVNNLHSEAGSLSVVGCDSDSMDEYVPMSDVNEQMKRFAYKDSFDSSSVSENNGQTLITMVTDDVTIKEGRIRQWLTSIDADEG